MIHCDAAGHAMCLLAHFGNWGCWLITPAHLWFNQWQPARGLLKYCHTARIHTCSLKATAAFKLLHTSGFKSDSQCCSFEAKKKQRGNKNQTPASECSCQHWAHTESGHSAVSTEDWTQPTGTQQSVCARCTASHGCKHVYCWEAEGSEKVKPRHLHLSLPCLHVEDTVLSRKRAKLHCQQWKHPHPVSAHKGHTSKQTPGIQMMTNQTDKSVFHRLLWDYGGWL